MVYVFTGTFDLIPFDKARVSHIRVTCAALEFQRDDPGTW